MITIFSLASEFYVIIFFIKKKHVLSPYHVPDGILGIL